VFFRVTRTGGYSYIQIAESYRDGKKVRQRILATLGRADILQSTGTMDRLLRSGMRFTQRLAVIDAHAAGKTEPVAIRKVGPDLVFGRLWEETGIQRILRGLLGERRYGFDVERAIYLTVLHRLFASGSDRAAENWRDEYRIEGAQELELHHLYRAMAFLGEAIEGEPETLGSPRCTKDLIEESLFDRRRDLFAVVDLVFFDTTSIYFEGAGGETIGQYGYSKDHRPDLKQMIVGFALDAEGCPLCCEMWPGNTTDVKTLIPLVDRMRRRFRIREVCVVADRGMISDETIAQLERAQPPVRYILGVRMRRQNEVSEAILRHQGAWEEIQPARTRAKDPQPLKLKDLEIGTRRYVVCLNEEQRRKDAHDRAAIVEALTKQLKCGDKSLVGNKGYRKFLTKEGEGRFAIDEAKIKDDARFDGKWVLRTNTDYDAEIVARAYKNLLTVESLIRTTKSILATRPIYHKCDETIRGHVFCSFLAILLKTELESRMSQMDLSWEWDEVIRGLNALQEVEAVFNGHRFLLRSQLTGDSHKAIRAAGVAVPPTIKEL
jgi:hypothetical protein